MPKSSGVKKAQTSPVKSLPTKDPKSSSPTKGGSAGRAAAAAVAAHFKQPSVFGPAGLFLGVIVAAAVLGYSIQWQFMFIYALLLCTSSPWTSNPLAFFRGKMDENVKPRTGCLILSMSSFISWVFAKSVYNASSLGASYGWIGGLAYSAWYVAFLSTAFVVYKLRGAGFTSIPEAIHTKFGKAATAAFMLAVSYRLVNEIWSNAMVVASFYGPVQTIEWWVSALVSVFVPVLYVMNGGMRSSLMSDVIQGVVAIFFLGFIAFVVTGKTGGGSELLSHNPVPGRAMISLEGGLDLLFTGLLQGFFSYAFFDPVLTDRAFLGSRKVMVTSFVAGGTLAALFIFIFGLIGVYGSTINVGGSPADISNNLGGAAFSIVNLIMMTSSLSTLDSTFSSISKIWGVEAAGMVKSGKLKNVADADANDMKNGRIAIVLLAIIGAVPLMSDLTILSATTVSGTIVMGLGPPVFYAALSGKDGAQKPFAFHLSFWGGVALGVIFQMNLSVGSWMNIGEGKYAKLFGFNLYGLLIVSFLFALGIAGHHFVEKKRSSAVVAKYDDA